MKRRLKDEPYISNYPVLRDWLDKHGGQCAWQLPRGPRNAPTSYVECWIFPGLRLALIEVRAHGQGWDIFTACSSDRVDLSLRDAEERLGLKHEGS